MCAHGALYMHLGIKGCPRAHGHRMHMEQHGMHPLGRVPTSSALFTLVEVNSRVTSY